MFRCFGRRCFGKTGLRAGVVRFSGGGLLRAVRPLPKNGITEEPAFPCEFLLGWMMVTRDGYRFRPGDRMSVFGSREGAKESRGAVFRERPCCAQRPADSTSQLQARSPAFPKHRLPKHRNTGFGTGWKCGHKKPAGRMPVFPNQLRPAGEAGRHQAGRAEAGLPWI